MCSNRKQHDLLITELNCSGVRDLAFNWIKNDVSDRQRKTTANGYYFTNKIINAGLHQWSIFLFPTLYIV